MLITEAHLLLTISNASLLRYDRQCWERVQVMPSVLFGVHEICDALRLMEYWLFLLIGSLLSFFGSYVT